MRIDLQYVRLLLLLAAAGGCSQAAEPLTLRDALKAALETTAAEKARVLLAYGRLHYLESQNKSRFELRPQLGLLAFSNPLLLATNLGSGLLWQRFQAPGTQALRNAEFDVLASEVACARRRVEAQVETARTFFDLLELQQGEAGARQLLTAWRGERDQVTRLLTASRITVTDKTAFDVALVELEMDVADAESRRRTTAVDLARLAGFGWEAGELQVTDQGLTGGWEYDALGRDALIGLAIERREELKLLREKLAAIPGDSPAERRVRFDSFGANYAHVGDGAGRKLGIDAQGFLLGGHTGRADLGIAISLRATGEQAASEEVAAARRQVIQLELKDAEDSIRTEVAKVWLLAAASRQKLELSARKLSLTRQSLSAIRTRVDHGLGPLTAVLSGEMEVLRQQSNYREALSQQRSLVFHLMAATGVAIDDLENQKQ